MVDPYPPRAEAPWAENGDTLWSVGYPVHRPVSYREWTNPHGCDFTDWKAACGAGGTFSGNSRLNGRLMFGTVLSALRAELCRACWPDRWRR